MDRLPTDQEAAPFPEVVRTKTFYLTPMNLEEALVQARLPCTTPSHSLGEERWRTLACTGCSQCPCTWRSMPDRAAKSFAENKMASSWPTALGL